MTKQFFLGVLIILILFWLGGITLSSIMILSPVEIKSLIYSGILTTINIVSAYFISYMAIKHQRRTFQKLFFSGMLIRFIILIVVITFVIKYLEINKLFFLLSFFLLYFIFQFWEITVLNRILKQE